MIDSYKKLFKKFIADITKINSNDNGVIISNLLNAVEQYFSNIPADITIKNCDISLYDFVKTSISIIETTDLKTLSSISFDNINKIQKNDLNYNKLDKNWTLLCCDFGGIQNFIYNIEQKKASNNLTGRSIFVGLLCDAVSDYLLKKLNYSQACKIYCSGGKFFIIIAKNDKNKIIELIKSVNLGLFNELDGDIYLNYGSCDLNLWHFSGGNMSYAGKM